jgi:hypothetical protein
MDTPELSGSKKKRGERQPEVVPEHRVVTIPQIDPSTAWNAFSERRQRLQQERAQPANNPKMVLRAHAQMGVPTSRRHLGTIRRFPPIPNRSGRQAARRILLWRTVSLLGFVAALLLAITFAFTSNAFRIGQVTVTGTHNRVLIGTIQRLGMQGQNIFLLDVATMTERIGAFPLVSSVSLSKQWPNVLTVTVVERKPVLLWQTAKGIYSVDTQGMIIAPASETPDADHLNTVIDTGGQQQGQHGNAATRIRPGVRLNSADVVFAMDVFTRLPQMAGITAFRLHYDGTIYRSNVNSSGVVSKSGSFVVESPKGWTAYLGGPGDTNPLENRLIELQQILAFAQQQQLSLDTIDLRYGLHPVYTLKR